MKFIDKIIHSYIPQYTPAKMILSEYADGTIVEKNEKKEKITRHAYKWYCR